MVGRRATGRRLAVLGGTFDRFHAGHEALLRSAFEGAADVKIGVTTAAYLRHHRKPFRARIQPYSRRVGAVQRWIRGAFPGRSYEVVPLNDEVGGALRPDADLLVVSAGTIAGAKRILRRRQARRLPRMKVRVVSLLLADDHLPISSSRIRAGVISRRGRRFTALVVRVRSEAPTGMEGVLRESFQSAFAPAVPQLHIVRAGVDPRATRRPPGLARARRLRDQVDPTAEWCAGVAWDPRRLRAWVALASREAGVSTLGPRALPLRAAVRSAVRAVEQRARLAR